MFAFLLHIVYGYGTLAVLIISICPMFGLFVVKWQNTRIYKYLMVTMLGLAVGTMVGDALLHLIPAVNTSPLR